MEEIDRPLTEEERNWLIRGLNSLATGEAQGGGRWVDTKTGEVLPLQPPVDPDFFLRQVDDLRVRSICTCGEPNCHTVTFQHHIRGRAENLVCYYTEDERFLIIFVNADTGLLSELEVV